LVNKIGVQIKTKVVLSFEVKDLGEQRVGWIKYFGYVL
jgi:hypothetical protein